MAASQLTKELRDMLDDMGIRWEADPSYYYQDFGTSWTYKNVRWTATDEGFNDGKLLVTGSFTQTMSPTDFYNNFVEEPHV